MDLLRQKFQLAKHCSEERLEEYAFGRVSEEESAAIERHLLVCEQCQESLAQIDEYILLMKGALQNPAAPIPEPPRWRYVTAGSIAAGIAVAAMVPTLRSAHETESVELVSVRGAETALMHAGHHEDLHISISDCPDADYRVEVVDGSCHRVWSGSAAGMGQRLRVIEPKALRAGTYWVRLYSTAG